jgi:hypothetical protein
MCEKWMLMLLVGLFFLCETVEGHGTWGESSYDRGDVVVTIFEITIVMVLVACCIGMFQQYDPYGYMGWNTYGPTPPPLFPAENSCGTIRITVDDLKRAVNDAVDAKLKREVEKRVKYEVKRQSDLEGV